MDGRAERPTTWMWACRICDAQGFVEPPDACPNCGASGSDWYEWFPLAER